MALDEDHSVYFDTDLFGSTGKFLGNDIDGIFDDEYELADIGEAGVNTTVPVFTCALADLLDGSFYKKPEDLHDQEFNVNDTQYKIKIAKPDGTGQVTLILKHLYPWLT